MLYRTISSAVIVSLLLGALSLRSAASAEADKSIKIGLNYPASGRYKEQGLAQARGALLAIKEINASGGVMGKPLELLRSNTASKPERAADNVDELVKQGAIMLFGGASSSATVAAAARAG